MTARVLLEVDGLTKQFRDRRIIARSPVVKAVDDVSFRLYAGEVLAVVGESGSGKSTLVRCLLGLDRPTAGTIHFDGRPLRRLRGRAARTFHRQVQAVFQDPYSSLDPRWPVRRTVREALDCLDIGPRSARDEVVRTMLDAVGLPQNVAGHRPAMLSGGQCQRVALAAALACEPRLLIADEPVTALDVSVQAKILNLVRELRRRRDLTILLVSHDLAVVEHISDRVAVMYRGQLVETGRTAEVLGDPRHPHTQALVSAMSRLRVREVPECRKS